MITVIAVKDPTSRELYELKIATTPPTTLETAAEILMTMLRGRLRCEEIDQLSSGTKQISLVTDSSPGKNVLAALVAAGIDPAAAFNPEQLAALVSTLAPPDPRMIHAGKGEKDKVSIPRGPDGKPTKWVEGMALCRCGVNGGKHLFADCPKKKEREKKDRERVLYGRKSRPIRGRPQDPSER